MTRDRSHVRKLRPGSVVLALLALGTGVVAFTGSSSAEVTTVKGSAYGYFSRISLFGGPAVDRGPAPTVTLPSGGSAAPVTATAATGDARYGPGIFFTSGPITVTTQGTPGPTGSVTSSTDIQTVNTSGAEVFTAARVTSTCTAAEAGASGSTTITGGTLQTSDGDPNVDGDETVVPIPANPAPNTTYNGTLNSVGDTFRYIFNEQIVNPDGSLTVNAGHQVAIGPTAVGDLYIGQSVCGVATTSTSTTTTTTTVPTTPVSDGYRLVASDGGIFAFGNAPFLGSTGSLRLNKPIVGMASTPRNDGYWLVASDGGIFAFGNAKFSGSTGALTLAKPIVGMAPTPTGGGYWLVASDGGVFAFGDARFLGSTGALTLARPIVGMAPMPTGGGYFLVASDGGVFAFGDALFKGSTGALTLTRPIVGMAVAPAGGGYHLVASDGGIFAFGNAVFRGSTGALTLNRPIVGMAAKQSGGGYWLIARDGGIFAFGDAQFMGSTGAIRLNQPIVGGAAG